MQPIIPCTRCGYATAPAFPRCWCCGRPVDQCARARRAARRTPGRRAGRRRKLGFTLRLHLHRKPAAPKEDLAELLAAW